MKLKTVVLFILFITSFCCKSDKKDQTNVEDKTIQESKTKQAKDYYQNGVLEVTTEAMDFQTADTINSGWNTIVYRNLSQEVHFILLDKLPSDSIGEKDIVKDLMPPFDQAMRFLMKGKQDSAMAEFGKIPIWFNDVKRYGGTGLLSPGMIAKSFVKLDPGKYMMECYVKMGNGEFHTSHGMWKLITVTDEKTNLEAPSGTLNEISISSKNGYSFSSSPQTGIQRFKVNFIDQVPYEHFSGHDVNLVKYESGAVMDSLIVWLNWMRPRGLRSPAPDGFTFYGGMNNCEAGETGYFEANLDGGNYIFISETPDAKKKGLYKEFTVKANQ